MAWDSLENVGADIKTQGDSTKNDYGQNFCSVIPWSVCVHAVKLKGSPDWALRNYVLAYLDRMVWERVLVSDMAWVVVWGVAWDEAKVVDLQEMLEM